MEKTLAMPWYTVIKTINRRKYLYLQMTYRLGSKVKTKNKYLGPLHKSTNAFGGGAPSNLPSSLPPQRPIQPSTAPSTLPVLSLRANPHIKVSKIRRKKPIPRAIINRQAAYRRLLDEAQANYDELNDLHKHGRTSSERLDMHDVYNQTARKAFRRRLWLVTAKEDEGRD